MPIYLLLLLISCTPKPNLNTFVETDKIQNKPIQDTIIVKLTSYYTPIIAGVKDYGVNGTKINYKGKELTLYFPKGAVAVIEREGFAIVDVDTETLQGRYIIDHNMNVKPYIAGSQSNKLQAGQCATDNKIIPYGANITIPALGIRTKSKDTGGKIDGNDLDYYLGQGEWKTMEKLSYRFNGKFKAIIN
jgi:membrane-bound lytic murein transglycosylase